jgi:hypothetical protein
MERRGTGETVNDKKAEMMNRVDRLGKKSSLKEMKRYE